MIKRSGPRLLTALVCAALSFGLLDSANAIQDDAIPTAAENAAATTDDARGEILEALPVDPASVADIDEKLVICDDDGGL